MGKKLYKLTSERLTEALKENGMMQKELAAALKYTVQHVSHLCTGESRITPEIAEQLTRIFPGYRYEYFLGIDSYKTRREYVGSILKAQLDTSLAIPEAFKALCVLLYRETQPIEGEVFRDGDYTIQMNDLLVDGVRFTQEDMKNLLFRLLPHIDVELDAMIRTKRVEEAHRKEEMRQESEPNKS